MRSTATQRWLTPLAAATAAALAAYAWVGPLPFSDPPPPPPEPTPRPNSGQSPTTTGPVVGSDRPTEFTALLQPLADLRPPESDDVELSPVDEPPPEPVVQTRTDFDGWSYTGYIGTAERLVAIVTVPGGVQHAASVGQRVGGDDGPTVESVTRERVVMIIDGDTVILTLDADDDASGRVEPGSDRPGSPQRLGNPAFDRRSGA